MLYDGLAPLPPYNFVRPPGTFHHANLPPVPGDGTLTLTRTGSGSASVVTGDDQAGIIFPQNAVAPRAGETAAHVAIIPLDPVTLRPAPSGLRFDGNAYRFKATYATSGRPAIFRKPMTVVLRFPTVGTQMLRETASGWVLVRATVIPTTQQIYADTPALGTFTAAAPRNATAGSSLWYRGVIGLFWVAIGIVSAALIRDYLQHRRYRRNRRASKKQGGRPK
jgi:hypothetical protein